MTVRNPLPKSRRPGFTLVEMLTVIVIIGILAAMTVAGAIAARNSVRRGIVIADIKQLESALQTYKSEVGELPPDFAFCDEASARGIAARARVVRHLRKRFPRMKLTGTTDQQFNAFLAALPNLRDGTPLSAGPGSKALNPSTALTFWLGGITDADGKPRGFHEDPTNPFKLGEPRSKPPYDFNTERMDFLQLNQPNIRPASPYVYFRAVKNNGTGRFEYGAADSSGAFTPYSYGTADNICVPYLEDASVDPPADPVADTRVWRAPETYQIISAGLDGAFSNNTPAAPTEFRYSKLGENFTDADYDNLASFSERGDLQSEL